MVLHEVGARTYKFSLDSPRSKTTCALLYDIRQLVAKCRHVEIDIPETCTMDTVRFVLCSESLPFIRQHHAQPFLERLDNPIRIFLRFLFGLRLR